MKDFVHLHTHSEYSLLDSCVKVEALARRVAEIGQKAIAVTDHGGADSFIKFQTECKKNGVKPIFGCELYVVDNALVKGEERRFHAVVLAKNNDGVKEIMRLLSFAHCDGFFKRPRISVDMLLKCNNLILSTACANSFAFMQPENIDWLKPYVDHYGDDFYFEVMPHDWEQQKEANDVICYMAKYFNRKIVATNDIHYLMKDDNILHQVVLAVNSHKTWNDPKRWKFDIESGMHLRTVEEMEEAFKSFSPDVDYKQAIETTIEISEKCNAKIEKRQPNLPCPVDVDDEEKLMKDICEKRLAELKCVSNKVYFDRYVDEFKQIKDLGFVRYFLIVWDLIKWCRENGIAVGPGRGSVGGSLVAYLMQITKVDPLKYDLVFARFISEGRIDYPDIDMDFEDARRHEVVSYLKRKYGERCVANVATFGTLAGKVAVKDIARVFEVSQRDSDLMTQAIVRRSGGDSRANFSILDTCETFEEARLFKKKYPHVIDYAARLEGQAKQCISGASILKTDIGEISIFDCYKKFKNKEIFKIKSLVDSIELDYVIPKNIIFNGKKKCIKLTLKNGDIIECTDDHKILTQKGWKTANTLKIGAWIAVNGEKINYCMCGCGKEVLPGRKFVSHHNIRGKFNKGAFKKGQKPANYGSTKETSESVRRQAAKMIGNCNGSFKKKIRFKKNCVQCGSIFEILPWQGSMIYCSRRCSDISKIKPIVLEERFCACGCGKIFECKKGSSKKYIIYHHSPASAKLWLRSSNIEKDVCRLLPKDFILNSGDYPLGRKYPDIVSFDRKKIVEVFGDYWHSYDDGLERISIFRKLGYDVLIVREFELSNTNKLKDRLNKFVFGNFSSREIVKFDYVIKMESVGEKDVYDIELDTAEHAFVANNVIVHNCGIHAAGIVVSADDLYDSGLCYVRKQGGVNVVNWDKEDLEYAGLMKMDILGLSTLTVLESARRMIKDRHKIDINFDDINLNDKKVLADISKGNTVGVFQLQSLGQRQYVQRVGIDSFNTVIDVNALYRPGTLKSGLATVYVNRKHGREKVEYLSDQMKELTQSTQGIVLYQEQVMWILNKLAGIPWKTTDTIRKIVSKSQGVEAFAKFKNMFVDGCLEKKSLKREDAEKVFELIQYFGGYGFNKCVSGDTEIIVGCRFGVNNYCQRRIKISDAYKMRYDKVLVYSEENKKSYFGNIKKIYKTGTKILYRVYASNNRVRTIDVTLEHKFLTDNGWKMLKELKLGDNVVLKCGSVILKGDSNPAYKTCPWNKGKTRFDDDRLMSVSKKKIGHCPDKYTRDKMSVSAKKRNIHGHTGKLHTDETKQIIRDKTLKQYTEGRFPQTDTKPCRLIWQKMIEAGIVGFLKEVKIGHFSADIANEELGLIIEINGDYWHANPKFYSCSKLTRNQRNNVARDKAKILEYNKLGFKTIILWEDDILNNIDNCIKIIKEEVELSGYNPYGYSRIDRIEKIGEKETYDIEIDGVDHNYIANMFVVHNSHSTAYSMIGFYCAWLKYYYSIEFMTAALNSAGDDFKILEYVRECIRLKINVEYPDINLSTKEWSIVDNKMIVGLLMIKGVGQLASANIEEARIKGGRFKDLKDFINRVERRLVNRRVILVLAKAGALRSIGINKKKFINDFDNVMKESFKEKFDPLMVCGGDDYDDMKSLSVTAEVLQIAFAADPVFEYRSIVEIIKENSNINLLKISDIRMNRGSIFYAVGRMSEIRYGWAAGTEHRADESTGTIDNLGLVYGNIEDESGYMMLVASKEVYEKKKRLVENLQDKYILVKGFSRRGAMNMSAEDIWLLDDIKNGIIDDGLRIRMVKTSTDQNYFNDMINLVKGCDMCKLHEQCRSISYAKIGLKNVLIVGDIDDELFLNLEEFGLSKDDVYVSSLVKCCSYQNKVIPTKNQISYCSSIYLDGEIKVVRPSVILSLGADAHFFFSGVETGIVEKNASIEWSYKYNAYVVYVINPSMCFYKPEYKPDLVHGIKVFADLVNKLS